MIAQDRDDGYFAEANLAAALTFTGAGEEALTVSEHLVAAAEATDNPLVLCYTLVAFGYPRRDSDPVAAYEAFRRGLTIAIRNHMDSGSFSLVLTPLAILSTVLDRLGRHESAATISGFADTPFTRASFPEMAALVDHLREALGDDAYGALAGIGKAMTPAAMATYAFEQIDLARATLRRRAELR
jgi:hypothetical protein